MSASPSALLRSKDLKRLFPEKLVLRAHHAGWIKPALVRHGFTVWPDDTVSVLKNRLLAGEYPPRCLPCDKPKEGKTDAN